MLGLVIGTAGSMAVSRYLESLLFGVTPTDTATFLAVPLLLAAAAVIACYIPAWRAVRIDPLIALRDQ